MSRVRQAGEARIGRSDATGPFRSAHRITDEFPRGPPFCLVEHRRTGRKGTDMTALLTGKTAIVYGGGGGIGGGVARTFAREGGKVFLVGRTRDKLDAVAYEITSAGGSAEVAVVD